MQASHFRPRHSSCLPSSLPQAGPSRLSQLSGGEAGGPGVWSSPFAAQGHDTAHSVLSNCPNGAAPTQTGDATNMQKVVMEAMFTTVADNLSTKAATQVSQLHKWFPSAIGALRPYFSVSQTKVRSRLLQLLFPFCALWSPGHWHRRCLSARDIDSTSARPASDSVSMDLYTPLMALITYVLLYALTRGAANDFQPELLGRTASIALLLLTGEVVLAKVSFYLAGAGPVSTLDLFSYCGCKYVHLALLIALRLIIKLTSLEPATPRSPLAGPEASVVPGTAGQVRDSEAAIGDERAGGDGMGVPLSGKQGVGASPMSGETLMWVYTVAYLYLLACAATELFVLLRPVSHCSQDNDSGSNWQVSRDGCRQSAAKYVVFALSLLQLPLCWLLTPSFAPSR